MRLYFKYRVLDSIKDQLTAMLKGVYSIVPREFLSVFDYQEMELLMCGIPNIDVSDWKRNTEYQGDYHAEHLVVQWFWDTLGTFTEVDKARLLQFTTGSSCVPAQGFKVPPSHSPPPSFFRARMHPTLCWLSATHNESYIILARIKLSNLNAS